MASPFSFISPTEQDWVATANGTPTQYAPGLTPKAAPQTGLVQGAATTAPDPYAAQKAAADAAKLSAYDMQNQGINNTANASATAAGNDYRSSILDYLGSLRQSQNTIDNKGVQAELARRQGSQNVLEMVHSGIKSGGVTLANSNAGTSSATDAIARAYASIGQHELSGVNSQYAQDQNDIKVAQDNQDIGVQTQARHNEEYKTSTINNIVNTATSAINNLKANLAFASLPDRINMQAQIDAIRNNARAQLAQSDASFSQGVAGIKASDQTTRESLAASMANAGVAGSQAPYQLSDQIPAEFRNTGNFASNLPIFVNPRKQLAS